MFQILSGPPAPHLQISEISDNNFLLLIFLYTVKNVCERSPSPAWNFWDVTDENLPGRGVFPGSGVEDSRKGIILTIEGGGRGGDRGEMGGGRS